MYVTVVLSILIILLLITATIGVVGLIWLGICACFGITFTWATVLGIWLASVLLKVLFGSSVSSKKGE